MIEPLQSDAALLADIRRDAAGPDRLRLWWLGQSGFLVQWAGRHLLLDPYLSDSLTRKYAGTDKPHVRLTRRVVAPGALGFVDVVTSSHNHTDHLDDETLRTLFAANPRLTLVLGAANAEFAAARLGEPRRHLVGLDDGGEADVAGFRFTAVPAAHDTVERDARGRPLYLGFVVRAGPFTLYHSGDTLLWPGLTERLRPFNIDLALLPINGRAPERRVAGNLDGPEAAGLAHAIGAKLVVPCHYEMFAFNTASPEAFVAACRRLGQPHRVLRAGERLDWP